MKKNGIGKILKSNPVFVKAGILVILAAVGFICVYVQDNSRRISVNENGEKILERSRNGEDQTEKMKVRTGKTAENMTISVSGRKYGEEELKEVFKKASEELETLILGKNESLDEIRYDLELISEVSGTGISVYWKMDRYDVIDSTGKIAEEGIPEEGQVVKMTAVLSYGGQKVSHEFYVKVFPPAVNSRERLMQDIRDSVRKSDEETETEEYMVLPEYVNGQRIYWEYGTETRAVALLILGFGGAVLLIISESRKKKEEEKKLARQMMLDYPKIINKFNLYIRAGMTIRRAWFMIAQDYENNCLKTDKRKAYEEMVYTMYQIRSGIPEGECYEKYGVRCNLPSYRKFGTMLAQNLRKGAGGLTEVLGREAEEAFEDRKNLAKKLGEEAGTKLMIPLFLMLIIVFAIVIIPAFFSIQI